MKVEIFRNTVKRRGKGASFEMMKAWREGIAAVGDEPIWIEGNPDKEKWMGPPKEKVAVHFGYGPDNAGDFLKGNRRKIRQHMEQHGGVPIVFDGGLWTSFGNRASVPEQHYFRCGLWSPMRNGNFLNKNSPGDRWQKIKSTFNIDERPWRKEGKYILLCTQPKDNWSMAQKDPYVWVDEVVEQLKGVTDRPLLLRPHPNHADKCAEDIRKRHPQIKIADMTRGGGMFEGYRWTFLEELNNIHCVVTHNSTAAVDAATYGVPVFLTSDLCLAWDIGSNDLKQIENPVMPDRTQWLHDLAYANWTLQEVKDGTVWRHMKPQVEKLI